MKRIDDWQVKNAMQTAIIDGEEAVTYQELEERVQGTGKYFGKDSPKSYPCTDVECH